MVVINEEWIPIINSGISWILSKMGPSKKDLKIQISELEEQLKTLSIQNQILLENQGLIFQALLNYLKSNSNCVINAKSIIFIGENSQLTHITNMNPNNLQIADRDINTEHASNLSSAFDGCEAEIAQARLIKPSDKR